MLSEGVDLEQQSGRSGILPSVVSTLCIDIDVFSGIIQRARGVKSAVETGCSGPSARYLQEADSRSRVAARAGHPSA